MLRRRVQVFFLWVAAVVLAVHPGCFDLGLGGHRDRGKGGGGGAAGGGAPPPPVVLSVNVLAPGTVFDERFDGRREGGRGGFFVGADAIPRLAYLRIEDTNINGVFDQTEGGVNDNSQIMFVRRRADGTWTAPVAVSALNNAFKENPVLVTVNVGINAAISFVFWRQVSAGIGEIRMARVNAGDPATVVTAEQVISAGAIPTDMAALSGFSAVSAGTLVASLDTLDGSVYAAWGQLFGTGGGTPDECVVAARYDLGGTGILVGPLPNQPNEKVGITVNNADLLAADVTADADLPIALAFSPVPAVGTGGTMHIVHVSTLPDNTARAVRHRARTGVSLWTPAAPGDTVSDTLVPTYRFPRLALEADGDLFVVWSQGIGVNPPPDTVHHAYRPVGGVFAASVEAVARAAAAPFVYQDLGIALDGSTPVIAYKRQDLPASALLAGGSSGTANASGPFAAETILHAAVTTEGGETGGRVFLFRETPINRIVIVYDAAPAAVNPFEVFGVIRPSGGPFGAEVNLSGTAALSRLAGFAGTTTTTARFAWIEGTNAFPRDVLAIPYAAGVFGAVVNLSGSPTDSHGGEEGQPFNAGFVGVFGRGTAPEGDFWWREHLGAAQHDVFFARN